MMHYLEGTYQLIQKNILSKKKLIQKNINTTYTKMNIKD